MLNHVTPRALMWVFEGIRFLSFDFEVLDFLQLPIWEPSVLNRTRIPQEEFILTQYGYNFGSATVNCWQFIKLYIVIGVLNFLFYPTIKGWVEDSENRIFIWVFKKLLMFLHFTIYFRLFLEGYLFFHLHIFMEIFAGPKKDFSYTFAFVWLVLLFLMTIAGPIYSLIWRKTKEDEDEPVFIKWGKMRPLYDGMK